MLISLCFWAARAYHIIISSWALSIIPRQVISFVLANGRYKIMFPNWSIESDGLVMSGSGTTIFSFISVAPFAELADVSETVLYTHLYLERLDIRLINDQVILTGFFILQNYFVILPIPHVPEINLIPRLKVIPIMPVPRAIGPVPDSYDRPGEEHPIQIVPVAVCRRNFNLPEPPHVRLGWTALDHDFCPERF